jgi:hypothetical protein
VVERELGAGPSELVVEPGGGPSATTDDGDPTWEDVEEEDEDLAAVMARQDERDNGEIVREVEETALNAYTNYAVTAGCEVSYISVSREDYSDKVTRSSRISFSGASRRNGS